MYGATAAPSPSAMDPMSNYNAGYAAQLQSLLASGGTSAPAPAPDNSVMSQPDNSQPSSLGPDTYRNPVLPPGQQTGPQAQPAAQGQPPSPSGTQGQPQSALAPNAGQGAQGGSSQGAQDKALSFRDAWQQQSKAQRQQQLENFQGMLAKGNQTIDSAYSQMMQKLGTRPQTDLSKSDKGMLLMEFGMKMMRNSASPASGGYGGNVGAAAGAAGADTMQTAMALRQENQGRAHNWDQMQQQLAIAQGKEKANFSERSLLEEGRDDRANQTADTRMNTVTDQQMNSNDRNTSRIQGQDDRSAAAIKQKNDQFFVAEAGRNTRAAGVQAGADSRNAANLAGKSALATSGGARGGAMKQAYDMYLATNGVDKDGNQLPEEQMGDVRQKALQFAANPSKAGLSDGQILDMATKDANRQYAPNAIQTMGMSEPDVEKAKQDYIQKSVNHLRSIRDGMTQSSPQSALATRTPAPQPSQSPTPQSALAPQGAVPRGTSQPAQPQSPVGIPSVRSDGKVAPLAALQNLQKDPASAPIFYKHFGYLPPQYQKYLAPQRTSALQ